MSIHQSEVQNILLRALPARDFEKLAPMLDRVHLNLRAKLVEEGRLLTHVYFPESGVCSYLAVARDREVIEIGMFGREGMSDMVASLEDRAPLRIIVQGEGEAWCISAEAFIAASQDSLLFLKLMLRYQQALTVQAAHTALSHGSFTIVDRLARWLLMSQDRLGDTLPLVHEFLAMMLAVRRAGVTEALHVLEGEHAIHASRGLIVIRDRDTLMEMAQGGYGAPEAEYERLIGSPVRGRTSEPK